MQSSGRGAAQDARAVTVPGAGARIDGMHNEPV